MTKGEKGMEIRCKQCGKLLGRIKRAEECVMDFKCTRCGLRRDYSLRNI